MTAGKQRHLIRTAKLLTCLLLVFLQREAVAAEEAPCFDFRTKVTQPLKELPKGPGDVSQNGTTADRVYWAAARGEVQKPIEKVLAKLLDHETTRDTTISQVVVEPQEKGIYLARHKVQLTVKVLFMYIRWTEDWAYALVDGTPEAPNTIVISYQKTEGTQHMSNFCDSMVLRRTPTGTDVSQYQQGRVTGRSPQAMQEFLKTVLQRLRAP